MSRIVLAMSGGVDSSVAAHLLLAAGHEVIGLFMRHGQQPVSAGVSCAGSGSSPLPLARDFGAGKQGCCSVADAEDARHVADMLGIAFYALNFDDQFSQIIDYFVDEYAVGRTPNPCIMCNNWLKFGKLFDYADSLVPRARPGQGPIVCAVRCRAAPIGKNVAAGGRVSQRANSGPRD